MSMTVTDSQGIADEMLPVADLAAQMRLPDLYEDVPGLSARLRLRLRAAIGAVERRLGRVLIAREFVLSGPARGGNRVVLPVAPVDAVMDVSVTRNGVSVQLGGPRLAPDAAHPVVLLERGVAEGEWLRVAVQAGYGPWTAVPVDLQQAVLLTAEALDAGEGHGLGEAAQALLAPFRRIQLAGAR